MLELQGKYTNAIIYADTIEEGVIKQTLNVCNHPIFKDCKIRIMPDCHEGKGCTIGFTAEVPKNGEVIPNLIGVDQSCSMLAVKLKDSPLLNDFDKLDKIIRMRVPSGFSGRAFVSDLAPESLVADIKRISKDFLKENPLQHLLRLGTLGGGNHFISIEKGTSGTYFIIHTGSRNFGLKLAIHFQDKAIKNNCYGEGIFKELSHIDGKDAEDYMDCAKVCHDYSMWSKKIIAHEIMVGMRWEAEDSFETYHNYINHDDKPRIIRKGAIECREGQKCLIPLNMRDGSLIVVGKGNSDWNYSGPHGAGRILSRSKAKETLSMEEYKHTMQGIYTTCINTKTLDESPMAYKDGAEIMQLIEPTAEIMDHLLPLYNFKAN